MHISVNEKLKREFFSSEYSHLFENVSKVLRFSSILPLTPLGPFTLVVYIKYISRFRQIGSNIIISVLKDIYHQIHMFSSTLAFLADEGNGRRATGNVCTPGTNLEIDGKLITQHIVKSSAPTFPAQEWVAIEIEVQGNEYVIHRVNGKEVLRYEHPQIDPEGRVESADKLLQAGASTQLSFGFIALQAEGQPVWFKNIELQPLE